MKEIFKHNWFAKDIPNANDMVMAEILSADDSGFHVSLLEYSGTIAFLPFSELSKRKIKKNPKSFLKLGAKLMLLVNDNDGLICLSLKLVKEDMEKNSQAMYDKNYSLYCLCSRLSHICTDSPLTDYDKVYQEWVEYFRDMIENYMASMDGEDNLTHPIDYLSSRSFIKLDHMDERLKLIAKIHPQLFGIKPIQVRKEIIVLCFRPDGCQYVKDILLKILEPYKSHKTDQELFDDQSLANLTIQLVGPPRLTLTVWAYEQGTAEDIMKKVIRQIQEAKFDLVRIN